MYTDEWKSVNNFMTLRGQSRSLTDSQKSEFC